MCVYCCCILVLYVFNTTIDATPTHPLNRRHNFCSTHAIKKHHLLAAVAFASLGKVLVSLCASRKYTANSSACIKLSKNAPHLSVSSSNVVVAYGGYVGTCTSGTGNPYSKVVVGSDVANARGCAEPHINGGSQSDFEGACVPFLPLARPKFGGRPPNVFIGFLASASRAGLGSLLCRSAAGSRRSDSPSGTPPLAEALVLRRSPS